nr:uncharacterized protein LOC112036087 [Quercus suber]
MGGERAKEITNRLPFDGALHVDTIGYSGGIWVLWNSDDVEVTQLAKTEQEIHVEVKDVIVWNKDVFGNIFHRKNQMEARLRGIQASLANGPSAYLLNLEEVLRKEYLGILQQDEDFWSVKSRLNWLIQGDRNTKFFHSSAQIRRRRNRIACLKDNQGNWVHDERKVASLIRQGFYDLFSTNVESVQRSIWNIPSWPCFLNEEDAIGLTVGVSMPEVKEGLWCLKPLKASGPDGLHAGFFSILLEHCGLFDF